MSIESLHTRDVMVMSQMMKTVIHVTTTCTTKVWYRSIVLFPWLHVWTSAWQWHLALEGLKLWVMKYLYPYPAPWFFLCTLLQTLSVIYTVLLMDPGPWSPPTMSYKILLPLSCSVIFSLYSITNIVCCIYCPSHGLESDLMCFLSFYGLAYHYTN